VVKKGSEADEQTDRRCAGEEAKLKESAAWRDGDDDRLLRGHISPLLVIIQFLTKGNYMSRARNFAAD